MTKARTDTTYDPQVDGLPVTMAKRASAADSTAHRSALTTPDLLGGLQTAPTTPTCVHSGTTEGNLAATNYYVGYVIRNGMGVTMASAITTVAATATESVKVTIPDTVWRVTAADAIYEIFLSADAAAPKHVVSFTAAQLAAAATTRCYCTTAETPVISGAGSAAWECYIGVVGTNAAITDSHFTVSTAYTVGAITPVNTNGYNNIDVFIDASPTLAATAAVLTSSQLTLLPVFLNDKQATNYHVGAPLEVKINSVVGYSKRQIWNLTTNGANVIILVASITNMTVNRIDITPTSVA